jgi:arylsulfatase A-like enzyme
MMVKNIPFPVCLLRVVSLTTVFVFFWLWATLPSVLAGAKPNVLFIAMDDLNDWIGCLGGHPQAKTPNLDRLANSGILFDNAHCPAPACNPSRTAVFTGISPHVSGLYRNEQKMRDVMPDVELLPKTFSKAGYWSGGSGKMLHYFIDAPSWDEYFPKKETENPFPETLGPPKRPVSLPRGGPWQYYETDWGPIDATDEEYGGDYSVAEWVGKRLSGKRDKPFFLACGIYRPHEPWFVPQKYFDAFPLETIQLPPGYREEDLDDLPTAGKGLARNRYFPHIRAHKQWKKGIQGYLASIYFADAMLGRVLDSLENGPHADNTIVVLWSDHGWHLGEKEHWQKFTAWRVCSRVPLIMRVPNGVPGLPAGTKPNRCSNPVNLLSLAPTLLELSGLPPSGLHDGPSLVPLLANPKTDWPHVSLTHLHHPGSFGLSDENWRYIRYADGGEELYDVRKDPYEWNNLAGDKKHAKVLERLRKKAPVKFAKLVEPKIDSLPGLQWKPLGHGAKAPPSKPDGGTFEVTFLNRSKKKAQLFWMDREGKPKPYALIEPGGVKIQRTRPGAVWMIARAEEGKEEPLGYFKVGDRRAKAIVSE